MQISALIRNNQYFFVKKNQKNLEIEKTPQNTEQTAA